MDKENLLLVLYKCLNNNTLMKKYSIKLTETSTEQSSRITMDQIFDRRYYITFNDIDETITLIQSFAALLNTGIGSYNTFIGIDSNNIININATTIDDKNTNIVIEHNHWNKSEKYFTTITILTETFSYFS